MVQVRALVLTFRDYLVISGQLDEPGLRTICSGIIQSTGEKLGFRMNDRVCLITPFSVLDLSRAIASASFRSLHICVLKKGPPYIPHCGSPTELQ